MAAILLDIDGVLHVSGEPISGAADAVRRLRANGHRLRFVTNTTTRSQETARRGAPGARHRGSTSRRSRPPPAAAVRALSGKRVLALTMHALVHDLEGIELVGEGADAVLLGGADETPETNLVFSYMNLARAFGELEPGAELYCLHRNRWWQTKRGPMLDAGAFVAGLEYAAQTSRRPSRQAERRVLRGGVRGARRRPVDDVDGRRRPRERRRRRAGLGMRAVLVRTGKFRPDDVERSRARPDGIVSSIAHLPEWLEEHL